LQCVICSQLEDIRYQLLPYKTVRWLSESYGYYVIWMEGFHIGSLDISGRKYEKAAAFRLELHQCKLIQCEFLNRC